MKQIYFGTLTKPQGLRGEFRVKNEISPLALKNINKIIINTNEYTLKKYVDRQSFVVLSTEELNDINQVEKLRNAPVYILSNDLELNEETWVQKKLVLDDGENIGEICDIQNYGASDILIISSSLGEIMCPVVDGLVKSVTCDTVVCDRTKWHEVVSYEN